MAHFTTRDIQQALNDPGISYWVKTNLKVLMAKDPVDAAMDAELLFHLIIVRTDRMMTLDVKTS